MAEQNEAGQPKTSLPHGGAPPGPEGEGETGPRADARRIKTIPGPAPAPPGARPQIPPTPRVPNPGPSPIVAVPPPTAASAAVPSPAVNRPKPPPVPRRPTFQGAGAVADVTPMVAPMPPTPPPAPRPAVSFGTPPPAPAVQRAGTASTLVGLSPDDMAVTATRPQSPPVHDAKPAPMGVSMPTGSYVPSPKPPPTTASEAPPRTPAAPAVSTASAASAPAPRARPEPFPGGAASGPTPRAPAEPPSPSEDDTEKITPGGELRRRAERLQEDGDPVGAARAYVELGIYEERVKQDRAAARAAYEAARALQRTLEPALGRIRRLLDTRADIPHALEILDDELTIAEGDGLKADLYAERARVCDALGRMAEARANYAEALRLSPLHAASLHGLESVIRRELAAAPQGEEAKELAAQLATHLERLAEAYAPGEGRADGDIHLAAWLHVERAEVLDRRLAQPEAARMALERAVAFEPAPGPVRDALSRHLVRHDETGILVGSLSIEAEHERDDDRAARLLYTAARLLVDRLGAESAVADARARAGAPMVAEATHMLVRAVVRAPHHTPSSFRILTELVRLHELAGDLQPAAEMRQKRLGLLESAQGAAPPEVIAHEHVRLSEMFDGLGRADQAAYHAERALALDPDDSSTRERLDRALQRLGRHEDRVRTWVMEANALRPVRVRVAALLSAADIAERHLRRRDEAIAHLRAGWAVDPGNAGIFDALSSLLAPPARDLETDGRGVRARIELYAQAATASADRARRVGLLEKLVSIWEDELGQPARAVEDLERILAIEPGRRTAILAMQRNAQRAGDNKQLARALQAEADLTEDPALERRLLLRAADILDGRLGDKDRALALVDRALGLDATDPEALRARFRIHDKAGRHDEARRALLALIGREAEEPRRFALWLEVARLDEHRLRRPYDAVEAFRQAALLRPRHPLPGLEIARLLRAEADPQKLVEALLGLAAGAADAGEYGRYLFQTAEAEELMLRDDPAALKCLEQAEALPDGQRDPGLLEAMERIHLRADASAELASLYTRWIERQPPAAADHRLRVALAGVLAEPTPDEAVGVLEGLVAVVSGHLPALRMLEQLHRRGGAAAQLGAVLRAEADVMTSSLARAGALWEMVSLEEHLGTATTLDALGRLASENPRDAAALDATVRIAGKITAGVGVPHPAAIATRARLVPAIKARKELVRDGIARSFHQIEEAILIEAQAPDDNASARAALAGYQAALGQWAESLLAARGLERLAEKLMDRHSLILSQLVLSKLAERARQSAAHVVRAAALTAEDPQPKAQADALLLYEEALRTDADCIPAARALARMLAGDVTRLVDRLGAALDRAARRDQIVLLGTEIGRAILRHRESPPAPRPGAAPQSGPAEGPDPGIGVTAMRHVLSVTPDDTAALLLMARLELAQRLWAEARDTLLRAVAVAPPQDVESRIAARFLLADIYESRLVDLAAAEVELKAVLALDDKNRTALERLVQVATTRGDRGLAMKTLTRLADVTLDPAGRVEVDLRLADVCRDAGDAAGRVRALADAVATAPNDARPGAALARLYRTESAEGAAAYVAALGQVVEIATARRLPIDHRWLTTMGMLEVTVMMRAREGVVHLTQAASLPGAPPEARLMLARGLEAANRNTEAAQMFRDVLGPDGELFARVAELPIALVSLEAALAKDGRVEERLAVEEVRACLGDVKPDRLARLRARRLPEGSPFLGVLAGPELARQLVPEARTPVLEIAAAVAPVAAKILRFELSALGVGSRELLRARDGHPTRLLADRMARALGIEAFELYLSPSWQGAARVYPGDPPAIVGSTSFAELPEPEQLFAFARLLVRIALGPTWLDELPVDAMDGLLLGSMRAIDPGFAAGEVSPARDAMAQSFLPGVQKAIGRRQKKLLEEIAPAVVGGWDTRAIAIGVRRSEYRVAYLLGGDLVAALDYLRRFDREIGRSTEEPRVLLQHPVTNELLRYALSAECVNERRKVGSVWA